MTQLVDKLQSIEAMKIASKGKTEAAYGGQEKPGMHMTNRSDWLENVRESSEKFILLGDSTKVPVTGEGDVLLRSRFGELKLKGVLLVKDLSMNLISQS
ncbi:hypothetical protein CLOP_g19784 [Closterium sp. NIES-67]|nr:hypothetical protein CLOP_g19784 [Closterium sp. NIES-67]